MAVTQATQLADFTSGIGTAGAILEVDNVNNKIGIGTTNPQALLQVGDIIKMDGVTGVITATSFSGNVTGVSTGLTGTPDITVGNIVAAGATFSGVVTYEDVTNVDSLGIVTARTGLEVTANGLVINAGVSTFAADLSIADKIVHTGDTNTAIRFPSADTFTVETSGTERLRVGSTGTVGVAGLSTATSFGAFNHLSAPFGGGTVTYTVTVATKTANHRYNGSGSSNGYLIDGVEAPFLTLTPGRTYRFVHDNTGSHPLKFYLEADKTTLYSTGVTFDNAYTEIVVSDTTPQVLHYQCTNHAYMGNAVQTNSNIGGGFNVVDESSDTSCNVLFTTDATGTALEAKTGTNLTFNSSSGALTATSFVGAVTGDVTGTASNASGATGDFSIADKIIHTGDTNTAIRFPAADTFTAETGGSEALRVDSSQRLLLGTTSSTTGSSSQFAKLQVIGNGSAAADRGAIVNLGHSAASASITTDELMGQILFTDNAAGEYGYIGCYADANAGSSDYPGALRFATTADGAGSATERLRIDSGGRLLSGTTSSSANVRAVFQGNSAGATGAGVVQIARGQTFTAADTNIGNLEFTDSGANVFARIQCESDGTVAGGSDHPGRIKFLTTTDGASSPTERLRITAAGNVSLQNDSGKFTAGAGDDLQIFHNGSHSIINNTTGSFQVQDAGTEKFRVSGTGTFFKDDVTLSNDSDKLNFGAGDDLQIYHDGTHSYIDNQTGALILENNVNDNDIILQTDDGSGGLTDYVQCDGSNGEVKLFHYGSEKLNTSSSGVTVTGTLNATTAITQNGNALATNGKAVAMALVFG